MDSMETQQPSPASSSRPALWWAIIIILVLLVLAGGWWYWGGRSRVSPYGAEPSPQSLKAGQSQSDDPAAIEADLNSMNLNSLDAEINSLDQAVNR